MNKEDQEWLDVLAGKKNGQLSSTNQIEAAAVRQALITQQKSIEREIKNFDRLEFEAFKSKLISQGLIAAEIKSKTPIQRKIALIGSFIAGSVSSSLLIFGLTSQVIVTRSSADHSLIEKAQEVIVKWKDINQLENTKKITINNNDPSSLAHTLEEKAWEIGLPTSAYREAGTIFLTIKNIKLGNDTSELKLLLGLHPEFSGNVQVIILK